MNKGIARCTGDVVGFLHALDVFGGPQVLATVAAAFADPAVCAVYGDLQYVRKQDLGQVVRHWRSTPFTQRQLAWGWMPPHPTLYVRRDWYRKIGGFDSRYRIAADYFSILSLFSQPGFKAVNLQLVPAQSRHCRVALEKHLDPTTGSSQRAWFLRSRNSTRADGPVLVSDWQHGGS